MFKALNLKWLATFLGILGGIMVSANIPSITPYGFIPFLISSIIWIFIASNMKESSLITLNVTFMIINMVGIYRWLS